MDKKAVGHTRHPVSSPKKKVLLPSKAGIGNGFPWGERRNIAAQPSMRVQWKSGLSEVV
jgi:hypothetical protein